MAGRARAGASKEYRITECLVNVIADLGLPEAGMRMAKAETARAISLVTQECGLTQQEVAAQLGIDQPKVPAITRGRRGDFSPERLLVLVNSLGMDVDIAVSPNPEPSRPLRTAVHRAEGSLAASRGAGNSEAMQFD